MDYLSLLHLHRLIRKAWWTWLYSPVIFSFWLCLQVPDMMSHDFKIRDLWTSYHVLPFSCDFCLLKIVHSTWLFHSDTECKNPQKETSLLSCTGLCMGQISLITEYPLFCTFVCFPCYCTFTTFTSAQQKLLINWLVGSGVLKQRKH